ncbi:SRPBCC family protein [Pseudonocardia spinosispora]|uniref:SRPBCC family protein n=1 Tax=Pseudonocardia spinosispora TaxID=103441 RepID=UPI000409747C|nr:SRPBCC family protein [Pseudonocardia spinosispora]
MSNTTLRSEGDRAAVRLERALRHPVEKVWRALTEPSHLNRWFPFDVEPELTVGGTVRFVDRSGGPSGKGTITDLEPPRLIAYYWEEDHLRWELSPTEEGSLLVLTHTVADRFGTASFATGWHACIDGLESVLAGQPVQPPSDMDAPHEEFVTRFGLDEGVVSDGTVRFERQLVRPADVAWRALVGPQTPKVGDAAPSGATVSNFAPGPVTESRTAQVLEYRLRAGGTVRWELGQGTGHGARLVLTHTDPARQSEALAVWRDRIAVLAAEIRATPRG